MFIIFYIFTLIILFILSFFIPDLWLIAVFVMAIGLIEKYISKKTIDVIKT